MPVSPHLQQFSEVFWRKLTHRADPSTSTKKTWLQSVCFDSDVIQSQCGRKKIKHAIGNVLREDEMDLPIHIVTISRSCEP